MGNIGKGILGGLIATVVLSAIMMMKDAMGVMPQLNIIQMLATMMGVSTTIGWVVHFMIGGVWGLLFALAYRVVPGSSQVRKGIVFGIGAWFMMMVAVMPMAGAGLFGMAMGMMAPVMTLMLHIIFGAVLGVVHGRAN